jgi:Fe2+ or Zn2+ uptake regulation protein
MDQATKKILESLKIKGYRLTKAREDVVAVLVRHKKPLSIKDIVRQVKVDEVSVYRTIALLNNEKLIEELSLTGGVNQYSLSHGHHHHVVCTNCNLVVHLHVDSEPKAPKSIPGFSKIEDHELTYYGLCTNCA